MHVDNYCIPNSEKPDSLAAAPRTPAAEEEVAEDSDSAVEEQTRVATEAGMAYKNPSPPPTLATLFQQNSEP